MRYRTLGRTGLRVSEVGFGCGAIGGMMVRGTHDAQVAAVQRALDHGITYFDTAASYEDGLSETHVGEVFAELRPQVTLGTKFTLRADDLRDIAGGVRRSLEESLGRLQMASVALLQLHNPVISQRDGRGLAVEDILGPGGVADALEALRGEGLIRHFGLTGLGETAALHAVIDSGRFDTVQAYFNMLNPSGWEPVPDDFATQDYGRLMVRAAAQGMGVIVIRVMAGGALAGPDSRTGVAAPTVGGALSGGHDYDSDVRRVEALRRRLEPVASMPRTAVRFALDCEAVSTVLVGFSTEAQIDEAVRSPDDQPLSTALREALANLWSGGLA